MLNNRFFVYNYYSKKENASRLYTVPFPLMFLNETRLSKTPYAKRFMARLFYCSLTSTIGNLIKIVVPVPISLSAQMCPPCILIISLLMDNPNPFPFSER